jgi:hypothetical protein
MWKIFQKDPWKILTTFSGSKWRWELRAITKDATCPNSMSGLWVPHLVVKILEIPIIPVCRCSNHTQRSNSTKSHHSSSLKAQHGKMTWTHDALQLVFYMIMTWKSFQILHQIDHEPPTMKFNMSKVVTKVGAKYCISKFWSCSVRLWKKAS